MFDIQILRKVPFLDIQDVEKWGIGKMSKTLARSIYALIMSFLLVVLMLVKSVEPKDMDLLCVYTQNMSRLLYHI